METPLETQLVQEQIEETEGKSWINLMFDSQILSTFMSCEREMDLRFNQHLIPIGGVSKAFEKGTLAHHGLAKYYFLMQQGIDYPTRKAVARDAMRKIFPTLNSLEGEDLVLVLNTFDEYLEFRKNDVFQVMFVEKLFRFIAYENYPLRIILTGRIDLGILESGSRTIIPVDHKSESESWFYSTLSNQFKIYTLACNANRLIVNRFGMQTSKSHKEKFKREDLNFDDDVLDEFKNEVLPFYAKRMIIANEDNYYAPNYAACTRGHWGCIFSDKYKGGICNVTRQLRNQKIQSYFISKEWNPSDDAQS
jgi:hypothetical protein